MSSPTLSVTGTNKSTGITHQIRLKLNFNDEKAWKKFSSRRLELIDTMRLSHKKASEQDKEILQCSRLLMDEFGYDDEVHLHDFIKLVRVAIQSVRRNRKRSSKSKAKPGTNNNAKFIMVKQVSTPRSDDDDEYISDEDDAFKLNDVLKTDSHTMGNSPMVVSRLPINSLLQPVLPKTKKSFTKLPSFASLLVEDEFGLQSPQSQTQEKQQQQQQQAQNFFSTKELIAFNKLLSLIKKSKACNDLSLDLQDSTTNVTVSSSFYENLEMLGSTIILSTISYIFEKFFVNLNPSSISYLRLKLNNDFTLSKILKILDLSLNEAYYNDFVSAQTFKRLIGCCVKDFGFDVVTSPLIDIIHEIILKDYPLISKNSSSFSKQQLPAPAPPATAASVAAASPSANSVSLSMPSPTASIISTSLVPPLPRYRERRYSNNNDDGMISVELKFNQHLLQFKFNPRTSSKPTFLELSENSKDAFHISSKYVFLKNLKSLELIKNDDDVAKMFDQCEDQVIKIGVFVTESDTYSTGAAQQQEQQQLQKKKSESPLDTLTNAAEVVESRSKENSVGQSDTATASVVDEPKQKKETIIFQPLL